MNAAPSIYLLPRYRAGVPLLFGEAAGNCMGSFVSEGRTLTAYDPQLEPRAGDVVLVLVRDPDTGASVECVAKHLEFIDGRAWLLCEQGALPFLENMTIVAVLVAKVHYPASWIARTVEHEEDEALTAEQRAKMLAWSRPALAHILTHGLSRTRTVYRGHRTEFDTTGEPQMARALQQLSATA